MNYKPAKLYDADGNLSARWFVFYSFKDPSTESTSVSSITFRKKIIPGSSGMSAPGS